MTHLVTINDATAAFADFCERNGFLFQQPNRDDSRLVESACPYWLLVNVHGELARVDAVSLKVHCDTP